MQTNGVKVYGLSKQFTGAAADRFEQEHIMWGLEYNDYMKNIHPEIPGVWFASGMREPTGSQRRKQNRTQTIHKLLKFPQEHAVFYTEHGGFAGSEFPKLRAQIFDSWLPDAGYQQARDLEIEVYHLYAKDEKEKRHYELWIPIT